MGKPRRQILAGKLACSKCRELRPVGEYTTNKRSPIGIGYICKGCRENKTALIEYKFSPVPVSAVPMDPEVLERTPVNYWERVMALLQVSPKTQAVCIHIPDDSFRKHVSVAQGLRTSSNPARLRLRIVHAPGKVYVQCLGTKHADE